MSPQTFASVLDMPASDIERPKPLPVGGYVCVVQGIPRQDKSQKKQTPFVEYTLKPLQAMEDVDQDVIQEMGGLGDKTIRATYYLTENSVYRLKEFLEHCGIEMVEGASLRQYIEQAAGKQVVAHIKHTASDDGTSVYANLASTAPVE